MKRKYKCDGCRHECSLKTNSIVSACSCPYGVMKQNWVEVTNHKTIIDMKETSEIAKIFSNSPMNKKEDKVIKYKWAYWDDGDTYIGETSFFETEKDAIAHCFIKVYDHYKRLDYTETEFSLEPKKEKE